MLPRVTCLRQECTPTFRRLSDTLSRAPASWRDRSGRYRILQTSCVAIHTVARLPLVILEIAKYVVGALIDRVRAGSQPCEHYRTAPIVPRDRR